MQLPTVPASSVLYMTDNSVCSKAEKAYTPAIVRNTPVTPSGMVYVIKVGSVYVVDDTAQTSGEFILTMTLSNNYKVLAKYAR
jgi:hypothetical protein